MNDSMQHRAIHLLLLKLLYASPRPQGKHMYLLLSLSLAVYKRASAHTSTNGAPAAYLSRVASVLRKINTMSDAHKNELRSLKTHWAYNHFLKVKK